MTGRLFVYHTKAVESHWIDEGPAGANVADPKQTPTRLVTISVR